jgi:hypothetical protein
MTADAADTVVTQLRAAVRNFEAVQRQYCQYGASDTEPDGVFQGLLTRAAKGTTVRVPTSAGAWELYASSMDCTTAAAALHQAAQAAVDIIQNCPLGQSAELKKYLRDYCWRYS